MIKTIRNKFVQIIDPLIIKNRTDSDYYNKTLGLFASFCATDAIMWFYVLYCYQAFNGFHAVTIGGLIFTLLHTMAPLVFFLTQSHSYTTVLIALTGLGFQTLFCIYTGGIFSPAAIWFSLQPVILGFFGSTILIYFSVALNAIIILGMHFLQSHSYLPIDTLAQNFRSWVIITSFIGLDFLVAVFTIAAIHTYTKKNNELERSKELTENLIRILAHDINNPLSVLRFYGPYLNSNPEKIDQTIAERIDKCSEDIQRITESVTIWISHRDGKMQLNPELISPDELCKHLEISFEEKLKNKNLKIKFHLNHNNKHFLADRSATFYQVFNNIISNAIKFSHENSEIVLTINSKEKDMEFIIRDYGIGIPSDLCDKVFSPFSVTNRRGTKNEKGTGFGLPIVGTIVKNLNGSIKIQNAKDYFNAEERGTIITITFPLLIS